MKTLRNMSLAVLALWLLGLTAAPAAAADAKLEVVARSANVRLKPDLESPVVGHALLGLVLTPLKTSGEWFLVELPPDAKGVAVRGYLHRSVVREVAGAPSAKAPDARPSVKPEARKKAPAGRSQASRKRLFLRLGAGYGSKSFDYANAWAFDMYGESGNASETYAVDASGVAFEAGLGYMFTPSLGVELSFSPASGTSKGTFAASFPHPFYFEARREKAWTDDGLKFASSEIGLDLVYAVPVTGRMEVSVFAGGTYFLGVKVESLKSLNWTETGYPYLGLDVSPQYATYSANAFGFNGGAGLDYRLSHGLAVHLGTRYSSGSAKVKIEGREVSVPTGGLKATLGLKLGF